MTLRIAVYGVVDPIRNADAVFQLIKNVAGYADRLYPGNGRRV